MNENHDFFDTFFINLSKLLEIYEPIAKRSGISAESAVLLTALWDYEGMRLPVKNDLFDELIEKKLICFTDNKYKTTGKGAILAKSFIELRKANFR